MLTVIISILHYGSESDTLKCLESLNSAKFSDLFVKIYVLDNNSREGIELRPEKYSNIEVNLLKSSRNLGFTGGHNFIYNNVKDQNFDFFLLLNNDSTVDSLFLNNLLDNANDETIGAFVPKIYFTKGREFHKDKYQIGQQGKVLWFAGGMIDWANVMSIHRGVDEVDHGQYDKKEFVDFATGACLLIRKKILDKVGLFDNKYFLYYEDADLCMKIIRGGYKILYVPSSVVWHNNAGSSGSGSNLHDYYLTRNRMLFGMRFAPLRTKIALIRESSRLLINGRKWQKIGIRDFYVRKFNKGSYQ